MRTMGAVLVVLASLGPPSFVWSQSPSTPLKPAIAKQLPPSVTASLAVGDVDGDGDRDVLIGRRQKRLWNARYVKERVRLYLNDGSGRFSDESSTHLAAHLRTVTSVLLEDLDGDGDLEAVIGCVGQARLYVNDGSGHFTDATATRLPAQLTATSSLAASDVDGDGDRDIFLGSDGYQHRLYLNDGSGHFSDATLSHLPAASSHARSVVLEDVDGDGDHDALIGNSGYYVPPCGLSSCGTYHPEPDRLYLNDGAGIFIDATATHLPDHSATSFVALVDVDGDGDRDALIGNQLLGGCSESGVVSCPGPGQTHLYLNDGLGFFSDATGTHLPVDSDNTRALAVADVDGDGDRDVLIGNQGRNLLYVNTGTGTFVDETAARLPSYAGPDRTTSVALEDVDGDGDRDIVIGSVAFPSAAHDRLYLNDGIGYFTDVTGTHLPTVP